MQAVAGLMETRPENDKIPAAAAAAMAVSVDMVVPAGITLRADSGGFGGAAFASTPSRLVMGGGGGAGDDR